MNNFFVRLLYEVRASKSFVSRNFNLSKRYWKWEIVFFVYTLANSVTIGFIGKGIEVFSGTKVNTSYLILYMLIGSILWGYLSIIFEVVAETVSMERWEGTIEYTFMAPVKRVTHLLSTCIYAVIYGIIRSIAILIVVKLFFDISLTNANLLSALMILIIASISFVGFGIFAAILPLISPEKGSQAIYIFQSILLMFSGVYYEIQILPKWMQSVARFSPATYALKGMRLAIFEGKGIPQLWSQVWPLIIMGTIMIPLGVYVFGKVEIIAKRTGVLKRSG
jgi:ABC-2 type transport system permease protein